jgi:putative spermidine/putrescine transport system substrate-binding protein
MAGAVKSGKTPQEAQHDPDACFAGMQDLKPNINSFWSSDAQQMQMLSNEDIWYMGSANTKGVYPAIDKGLAIDWIEPKEGAFQLLNSGTIVKGSSNEKLAMQVLDMCVSTQLQDILCNTIYVGPTNSKVKPPERLLKTKVPYGPDAVKRLIQVDWAWIQSQRDAWTERWNREVAS